MLVSLGVPNKMEDEQKNKELYTEYTKKIAQTEEDIDTLRRNERKQLEQIEQTKYELKKEVSLSMEIFHRLRLLGDEDAFKNQSILQSISGDVIKTMNRQQATLSEETRLLNRKLEEKRETFFRERGKIAW